MRSLPLSPLSGGPGVALLRLVPYARKGIDAFVAAVGRQPELWDQVVSQLDERLKSRALQVVEAITIPLIPTTHYRWAWA